MKKYIYYIFLGFAFLLISCEKETEPGGTAVESMAAEWWVTYEVETTPGNWTDTGGGHVRFSTYNTSANKNTEMWINDEENFWKFKSIVEVNYSKKQFFTVDSVSTNSVDYPDEKIFVSGGKVLKGAAMSPSGMPVDSIVFYCSFNDDSDPTTVYKVAGFRRTGFPNDDF